MSRAQAESVIKNIIREIAQECVTKGEAVSETLVAFMVKAVVLDPNNEFNVDRTLTKDDVQKLIRICVQRLMDSQAPSLDTIKMQVYFDMNYTTRGDFLEEHRRVLDSRLQPVVREITDSRARTRDEHESLYRKVVSAILLRSGLGSPTDIAVVREATAALQSVFPQTELGTFMSLTKRDKERQLDELTMIVTGIRLFNKECGKGGEGIDDLPAILNEAVPATTHTVDSDLQVTLKLAFKYTAVLEKVMGSESGAVVKLLKDALINCRQHQVFLHVILNDIISCARQVELLEADLAARMEQIQATVQSKTAVPTAQVYPQFVHLSQMWTGFQDEMVLLSVLSNILNSLEPFIREPSEYCIFDEKCHSEAYLDDVLLPHLDDLEIVTDEQRLDSSTGDRIDPTSSEFAGYDWLFEETTKNFDSLQLKFRGFCGWALVTFDRLLYFGNPEIGILRYRDNHYTFSSREAAAEFCTNPNHYIEAVAEGAKRSPELIQLLELHTQFASITPYSQGKGSGHMIEKPITKSDTGTQTDTHFYETNIVAGYEWNEWELRRKAIKLTNLRSRITHSMQTEQSNMRRNNATQCYPLKESGTQTKKDGTSSLPQPKVFLAGLRGGGMSEPTVMTKVDLTIDVDGT